MRQCQAIGKQHPGIAPARTPLDETSRANPGVVGRSTDSRERVSFDHSVARFSEHEGHAQQRTLPTPNE